MEMPGWVRKTAKILVVLLAIIGFIQIFVSVFNRNLHFSISVNYSNTQKAENQWSKYLDNN